MFNTGVQESFAHHTHSGVQTEGATIILNIVSHCPTGNRALESLTPAMKCSGPKMTHTMPTHNLSKLVTWPQPTIMAKKCNPTKYLEGRGLGIIAEKHTGYPSLYLTHYHFCEGSNVLFLYIV